MSVGDGSLELADLPILAGVGSASLELLLTHGAVIEVEAGDCLVVQGERGDSMFVLLAGALEIEVDEEHVRTIDECGSPIGEIQLLAGGRRSATVRSQTAARLLEIPARVLPQLREHAPELFERLLALAKERLRSSRFKQLITAITGPIDAELINTIGARATWRELARGERLAAAGDPCEGWYIVVSGRLEQRDPVDGVGVELGVGDSVGELSLVTEEPHHANLVALRTTELVVVAPEDFDALVSAASLIPGIVKRALRRASRARIDGAHPRPRFSSFTLTPLDDSGTLAPLCGQLVELLATSASALLIDVASLRDHLDVPLEAMRQADHPSWMRVRAWFEGLQTELAFVVLQDAPDHPGWSSFCREHADILVGVADGDRSLPARGEDEGPFARREGGGVLRRLLLLTHQPSVLAPTGTRAWLARFGGPEHLHLRWPDRGELGRLARILTGRGIGVVLSGGNAHAMAQLGALAALRNAGVPIDYVGGTSFGAIIAGLAAARTPASKIREHKDALVRFNPFRSLVLSRVGLLEGAAFDWIAQRTFADMEIEDLWLGMFAVCVNFTTTEEMVIERGPVWAAVRASGSVPVVMEPFFHEGQVLVDGGLVNNLPIDVMRRKTKGPLIAVDVSPDKEIRGEPLVRTRGLRGWFRRRQRGTGRPTYGLFDILMRSFTISSAQRAAAHKDELDLYITPDVRALSSTDFTGFDELLEVGRAAAEEGAAQLRERLGTDYFLVSETDPT